jgi:hypothetical protein
MATTKPNTKTPNKQESRIESHDYPNSIKLEHTEMKFTFNDGGDVVGEVKQHLRCDQTGRTFQREAICFLFFSENVCAINQSMI